MNEEKFSGKADLYEMSRPSYAGEAIDLIKSNIPAGSRIADIGAGTGIFTRQLVSAGFEVCAAEPNADMRERLANCGAEVVCASAENTGLPEKSFALVTAAQAFHWFDGEKFRNECRRILEDGGKVLLLWNNEDKAAPIINDINEVCRSFCTQYKPRAEFRNELDEDGFFAEYKIYNFRNDLILDRERFIANRMSRSHAPQRGDSNYTEMESALSRLFDKHSSNGTVTIPNITTCYLGTV